MVGSTLIKTSTPTGFGWQRDLPDAHDVSIQDPWFASRLSKLPRLVELPTSVDWRTYCGAVDDQGDFNTSPAHACAGLLQFCERRAHGRVIEPSRMFLYRTARRLDRFSNDSGVSLRSVLKAMVRFGVASESSWPFLPGNLNLDPDAFVYSEAKQDENAVYVRLDHSDQSGESKLTIVKSFLACGFSIVFGFPVYDSVTQSPDIAFPSQMNRVLGGQSVLAVGYADDRRYRSDHGAILIRNSWGPSWGDAGYGWLPYEYVRRHLAADFWLLLRESWLASSEFLMPEMLADLG
ncbi:MAG: C1 family peptidase [Planctomycetota bacterium]